MNELALLPGTIDMVLLGGFLVVLLMVVVLWFFVNRASLRTNEQITLLEELVDLQKRQNSLLRRLCEANEPEPEPVVEKTIDTIQDSTNDLVHMVAER